MEFHHERFLPGKSIPPAEIACLAYADRLEAGPYYDWTEIPWDWMAGTQRDRQEMLTLYEAKVHVNDPKVIYTVTLPREVSGTDVGTVDTREN
jgi:hypothetical protein